MSELRVEVCEIVEINPHPNADRLELATVKGWNCVVPKGRYSAGDRCIYFPIDSVLPATVEAAIFPPDSKVKLNASRVRTIKLRGAISQGLVVEPELFGLQEAGVDTDVTALLGVTKYEPPPPPAHMATKGGQASYKQINPNFRKYTSLENAKNYPKLFEDGEPVVVTEKIHGTNFRAGYVPFHSSTWWKKVKRFLRLAPKYEFVYGSHNVQLQGKLLYDGFYDQNVYAEAVVRYRLKEILKPGEVVYGEIFGDAIQKGYGYGCGAGERKLVLFDVMVNSVYLDAIAFQKWTDARQLPRVPVLHCGAFSSAKIRALTAGPSVLNPLQAIREGVVVRPLSEQVTHIGRKVLKFISDDYLLREQSEHH
jgi:RNA ligase (TIGR02306 family)